MKIDGFKFSEENINLFNTRGYNKEEINDFRITFADIFEKFSSQKCSFKSSIKAAKNVSKGLNKQEKEVLRKIHGLADPIKFDDLSDEGLLNLFYQPGESKDIDNDSFLEIGAGVTKPFPPVNAPDYIKQAWEDSTKDMTFKEKMMAQTLFWGQELSVNVKYDINGDFIGFYGPHDEEYTNIYAQEDFSFNELINAKRKSLLSFKNLIHVNSFKFQMSVLNSFQNNINSPLEQKNINYI